jgi:hypothetical protein
MLLLQDLADLRSELDVFDDLKKVNQDLRRG